MTTIRTRKELNEAFSDQLTGISEEYSEEQVTRSGWLKTQILELDCSQESFEDIFKRVLYTATEDDSRKMELIRLEEDALYRIHIHETGDDVYLDALDNRFVILYSFIKSEHFDKLIDSLTDDSAIDQAWLPQEFMNGLENMGAFKGYGGKFNNQYFVSNPEMPLDEVAEYRNLSFKSWGHTKRLLQLIQNDSELSNEFALTSMRIKRRFDSQMNEDSIIDDVTYSGRITSLGKSFPAHYEITQEILRSYRKLVVDTIEDRYGIHYENGALMGERLVFKLPSRVNDLAEFTDRLFSGKKPFRLWGTKSHSEDGFVRYEVLDMHINEDFTADVYCDRILILLKKGVCGNTILRLMALLQQYFGSRTQLVDKTGELIHLGIASIEGHDK